MTRERNSQQQGAFGTALLHAIMTLRGILPQNPACGECRLAHRCFDFWLVMQIDEGRAEELHLINLTWQCISAVHACSVAAAFSLPTCDGTNMLSSMPVVGTTRKST